MLKLLFVVAILASALAAAGAGAQSLPPDSALCRFIGNAILDGARMFARRTISAEPCQKIIGHNELEPGHVEVFFLGRTYSGLPAPGRFADEPCVLRALVTRTDTGHFILDSHPRNYQSCYLAMMDEQG